MKYNDDFSCHQRWLNSCGNNHIYCTYFKYYFIFSFVSFSPNLSPIYGGLGLSGGIGYGIILCLKASFLDLTVSEIYLGGMFVVFGYTMAITDEQYPGI